jgi:hypothetical protein
LRPDDFQIPLHRQAVSVRCKLFSAAMNIKELIGKSISMIVWNTEKDDDVHVYLGRLHFENNDYWFINQDKGWRVALDEEQLTRLKPVPDDLREILLNADYSLSMTIGDLPDTEKGQHQSTGMNWRDQS